MIPATPIAGPTVSRTRRTLARSRFSPGDLVVTYHVDSEAIHAAYDLQIAFYEADAPTNGEGRIFISDDVFTLADFNNGGKTVNLGAASGFGLEPPFVVVAAATDASGNTSEFSPGLTLVGPPTTFIVNAADDFDDGRCNAAHCSLREAIAASNLNAPVMDAIAL